MALIYRAIWNEDRDDILDVAAETAVRWLNKKGLDCDSLSADYEDEGEWTDPRFHTAAHYRLDARRGISGDVAAFRVTLDEDRTDDGQRWTSVLTAIDDPGQPGTLWMDVERHSRDPFSYVPFRAPALVKKFLVEGSSPRVGHVRLEPGPVVILTVSLAGLIRNAERRLPLIVFSHDNLGGADLTMARARAAYDRLAGVAQVFVLPDTEVEPFKSEVGEDLAVWGGGARLYLPNTGHSGLRPARHRYVSGPRAARSINAAADVFVDLLAATVPATPAPPAWDQVRLAIVFKGGGAEDAELLTMALDENSALDAERQTLLGRLERAADEYDELVLDYDELSDDLNRAKATLASVLRGDSSSGEHGFEEPAVTVSTISEAILEAGKLRHLAIDPSAPVDVEKLESTKNAGAWASTIWRAFLALDAYAADTRPDRGSFWDWCKAGTSPWSWPATTKKLAMTESSTVLNNKALRAKRVLPVDPLVSPDGSVEMLAHFKIAEGGGPIAPRVYFYDDSAGVTGKMHVGFIGPHEHMPNKSTN